MNPSSILSTTQLQLLLPALSPLAVNIRDFGVPEPGDLELLLSALDLHEGWMQKELALWAELLAKARGETAAHKLAYLRSCLQLRGVPEASAILAVSYASGQGATSSEVEESAPVNTLREREPENRTQPSRVSAEVVGFGQLKSGQTGQQTLYVEGGPGTARIGSSRAEVTPTTFGPGKTQLTIHARSSNDSNLLMCPLFLESATQRVELDVLAEWESSVPKSEDYPPTPPLPEPIKETVVETKSVENKTPPPEPKSQKQWRSGGWTKNG